MHFIFSKRFVGSRVVAFRTDFNFVKFVALIFVFIRITFHKFYNCIHYKIFVKVKIKKLYLNECG